MIKTTDYRQPDCCELQMNGEIFLSSTEFTTGGSTDIEDMVYNEYEW